MKVKRLTYSKDTDYTDIDTQTEGDKTAAQIYYDFRHLTFLLIRGMSLLSKWAFYNKSAKESLPFLHLEIDTNKPGIIHSQLVW